MDKSKWDWTVPSWLWSWEKELRERLCHHMPSDFKTVWDARYHMLSTTDVVFSDGTHLSRRDASPGIMPSGSKITISANSHFQVLLKISAAQELSPGGFSEEKHKVASMGDDTLERLHDIDLADYEGYL